MAINGLDDVKEELDRMGVGPNHPLRRPIPYPEGESPVDALRSVTEEYGRRRMPPNIPQVLQGVISHLRSNQNEILQVCAQSLLATEALIGDLVHRATQHQAYLDREKQIAETIKTRAENLKQELTNEFINLPAKTTE